MTKLTNTHLNRHQVNLIVYVLLVAAVAGILFGYQHHVSVKLNQQDRISCANRRVLITNQRLVLRIIRRNIHVLLSWSLDAADRQFMRPLRISAAQQVAAGLTTIAEVMTVLPPTE